MTSPRPHRDAGLAGDPYGFDRPLEVLRRAPSAPAESLLEMLLADWRRHLGTEEPPDDTTVVVVRRAG